MSARLTLVAVDSSAAAAGTEPDAEQSSQQSPGPQDHPAPDWQAQVLPLVPGGSGRKGVKESRRNRRCRR